MGPFPQRRSALGRVVQGLAVNRVDPNLNRAKRHAQFHRVDQVRRTRKDNFDLPIRPPQRSALQTQTPNVPFDPGQKTVRHQIARDDELFGCQSAKLPRSVAAWQQNPPEQAALSFASTFGLADFLSQDPITALRRATVFGSASADLRGNVPRDAGGQGAESVRQNPLRGERDSKGVRGRAAGLVGQLERAPMMADGMVCPQ